MKKLNIMLVAVFIILCAAPVLAAEVNVFVTGIDAVGIENRGEMERTLQTLLTSRLNGSGVSAVGSAAEADAVVNGTYISIGKIFSIDAIAKTPTGKMLARAFVQGSSQDELIPSVGKLAEKLSVELVKSMAGDKKGLIGQKPSTAIGLTGIIANEASIKQTVAGDLIKPSVQESSVSSGWLSERLIGAVNLIADGLTLPDGNREIFLAEERRLSYYRQGRDMKLVAEITLNANEKIISVDTLLNAEGKQDIYVTIVRGGELASQVLQVDGDKLVLVAGNLPYYFRSASLAGEPKKLYVQEMGRNNDFYGDVVEATRNGSNIKVGKKIKMPRYGVIYNFNQFTDRDGRVFTVVINPDGYLIVYDQQLNELWRSNDKFGGSELFFQREDDSDLRVSGDKYRWIFMNQRIYVTSTGDVLVGKNDGFWVMGNARSYKRGAIYCLAWNGSSLDEKWRTRETQNYMPDYVVDEVRKEVMVLQTVQRPGIGSSGASVLTIMKIE